MSKAHMALATLLPKARLIQLNLGHMMASFLTHEGLTAAGEEPCCVKKHPLSLVIQSGLESPDILGLEHGYYSFLCFRDIDF